MPLIIPLSELRLVAWSHQTSHFLYAIPLSGTDRTNPVDPSKAKIRAFGTSYLYGVTPTGDELDAALHWRAQGERSETFIDCFVFAEPGINPTVPELVALRQSVSIVGDKGQPLGGHEKACAMLASIRDCDWRFPARQCLPRDAMPQVPGNLAEQQSGSGYSTNVDRYLDAAQPG